MNENEVKGMAEQPVEISRWGKIKAHVKRNEDRYTSFAAGVVSGAVLFGVHATLSGRVSSSKSPVVIENNPVFNNINTNTNTNVVTNYNGYATKIIKCVETGEIFETAKDAAASAGVKASTFSRHINGHTDHVYGMHYEIIGQGTTT